MRAAGGDEDAPAALVGTSGTSPAAGPTATAPPPTARTTPAARAPRPAPTPWTQDRPVEVPRSAGGSLGTYGLDLPATVEDGDTVRYAVEVERGLPFDGARFARAVHEILVDERGWQGVLGVRFVQVADRGAADLTVTLASPDRTDELCAPLLTYGRVSCWNGERAVINALRWGRGSETYGDDLEGYRRYLVAHEVGHGLGRHHVGCPEPGAPAPVMVQQTKSLEGCRANPYPATA
ncbi:DUF3152 domain-containing protein [Vallicoccus soli]|uniref:DUF3152 domain-containing protein n=1 Tax=Vallicoccus soli TaxID=2339232 RepID=A0A3A3ZB67_9ACTN|nr:DUF3152 domain-containing protein [Vallicoccus soli]